MAHRRGIGGPGGTPAPGWTQPCQLELQFHYRSHVCSQESSGQIVSVPLSLSRQPPWDSWLPPAPFPESPSTSDPAHCPDSKFPLCVVPGAPSSFALNSAVHLHFFWFYFILHFHVCGVGVGNSHTDPMHYINQKFLAQLARYLWARHLKSLTSTLSSLK